jgi:proteasome beta subunit
VEEEATVEKLKTGTTTVGLVVKDAVILGADKRATMGNYIHSREITKIIPIAKHLAMTLAGSVGDNQTLARWMSLEAKRYELETGKPMSPHAAATIFANILSSNRYYPFWVANILAGYYEGKPYLYSIDMVGGVTPEKVTSSGSGSLIAFGVLDKGYKKDMDWKEGVKLVVNAIQAAMHRDSASGDGIDILVIDKNGARFLSKEEIEKLSK